MATTIGEIRTMLRRIPAYLVRQQISAAVGHRMAAHADANGFCQWQEDRARVADGSSTPAAPAAPRKSKLRIVHWPQASEVG